MDNLKISDEDIQDLVTLIEAWKINDRYYNACLEQLNMVKSYGIPSGKIHDALDCLYQYAKINYEKLLSKSGFAKTKAKDFLSEIDAIDQNLY